MQDLNRNPMPSGKGSIKKWVTLQLTEKGESILENDPNSIYRVIKKVLNVECFIPVHYNKSKSYENRIFLFKGYIFVVFNPEEVKKYYNLMGTQYFVGPLMVGRSFHLTDNEEIKRLKSKLMKLTKPNIKVGDKVVVLDGKYKHMSALVTDYYKKDKEVDLIIELKCMNIIVPRVPIVCLQRSNDVVSRQETGLTNRILDILHNSKNGLTRKQILDLLDLAETEKKRLSTVLARYVKKGTVVTKTSSEGKFVFVYQR